MGAYAWSACLGFLLGVVGTYLHHPIPYLVFSLASHVAFLVAFSAPRRSDEAPSKRPVAAGFVIRSACLLAAAFLAAVLRVGSYERAHAPRIPDRLFDTPIILTGVVAEDPDQGLDKVKVTVRPVLASDAPRGSDVGRGNGSPTGTPLGGIPDRVLVTLDPLAAGDVAYGDRVVLRGELSRPENFLTDTDREFDYVGYLAIHDVSATMRASSVEVSAHHREDRLSEALFAIKRRFVATVREVFPSPQSGLLAGIMIGEKSLLPQQVTQDFQIAGLTHMVVLSGYNITIVALSAMTVLAWLGLGYRARRGGALIIIPLFIVMTGMGASSVRAGIMSMIVFVLQITTRPNHVGRLILYALATMVYANPRILLYDPLLHMSFLAFVGLIFMTPVLAKRFSRFGEWFGLRDLAVETLSVQAFVMPYLLWMNGRFSMLLLFSNLLTVPAVPLIMGGGFLVSLLGTAARWLGSAVALPVIWGLSFILWVAHAVASVSFATVVIPPFGVWWMGVGYVFLTLFVWYNGRVAS